MPPRFHAKRGPRLGHKNVRFEVSNPALVMSAQGRECPVAVFHSGHRVAKVANVGFRS